MTKKIKITKQKATGIIKQFLENGITEEWYRDINPYLKAVILYGSVAKGINRPDSDIDILFILPLEIEEKYTKGEYLYKYDGYEINIVIRSIEGLRKIAKKSHDSFQSEVFRESEIIWQENDEVKELLDKITKEV